MNRTFFLTLVLLLLTSSTLWANSPQYLTSDGDGVTSHPVLFVHGRFSDAAKTYGVAMADKVWTPVKYENIRFRVIYDLDVCSWDRRLVQKHYYVQPIADIRFEDGRILHNEISITKFKIATRAIKKIHYEYNHIELLSWDLDPATNILNSVTYKSTPRVVTDWNPIQEMTKQFDEEVLDLDVELAKEWTTKEVWNSQEWIGKVGDLDTHYPDERDLVMHYNEGSTPDVIADALELNTNYTHASPKEGINSNGLYFYNAKRILYGNELKQVIEDNKIKAENNEEQTPLGCFVHAASIEEVIEADSVRGPKRWPDGMGQPYLETFYSKFKFLVKVGAGENSLSVPMEYTILLDSITRIEWESPKPNMTPQDVTIADGYLTYKAGLNGKSDLTFRHKISDIFGDGLMYIKNDPKTDAYEQRTQLYHRMVEVMDDFYGKGNWEDDPTAVIDIVTNSMGGPTLRHTMALYNSMSLDNPVNHINRIVSTGAPHMGSSFSTAAGDLDPAEFSSLIELKNHLWGINNDVDLIKISHVLLPNEAGIFLGTELDIHLDFKLTGKYFGPYNVGGKIYWNHFGKTPKHTFENDLVKDLNKKMVTVRKDLQDFDNMSANLSKTSGYVDELKSMSYPVRYHDGSRIPMTNFYIDGVDNFLQKTYKSMLPLIEGRLHTEFNNSDELREGEIDPDGATKAVMKALTAEVERLSADLLTPLDQQWCNKSDIIVDVFSQKGINPAKDFVTDNPDIPFTVKSFTRTEGLAHMNIDLGKISGGEIVYNSGSLEGVDVGSELLGQAVSIKNYPRPVSSPAYGYWGASKEVMVDSNSALLVSYGLEKRDMLGYAGPLSVKYFVKADPSSLPQMEIVTSSGMDIALEHIGGHLYSVTATTDFAEFNRGGYFPVSSLIEFKLSYSDGSKWDPNDDWSCFGSETIVENSHIVVLDSNDIKVSGLEPNYAKDTLPVPVVIYKEDFENGWNGWEHYVNSSYATAEAYVMEEGTDNNALVTYVGDQGDESWHVHARKSGIAIEAGKTYSVSISSRTEIGYTRNIKVLIEENEGEYTSYGGGIFEINEELQSYIFSFTSKHTDSDAVICVEMGNFDGTTPLDVVIDDVTIVKQ